MAWHFVRRFGRHDLLIDDLGNQMLKSESKSHTSVGLNELDFKSFLEFPIAQGLRKYVGLVNQDGKKVCLLSSSIKDRWPEGGRGGRYQLIDLDEVERDDRNRGLPRVTEGFSEQEVFCRRLGLIGANDTKSHTIKLSSLASWAREHGRTITINEEGLVAAH